MTISSKNVRHIHYFLNSRFHFLFTSQKGNASEASCALGCHQSPSRPFSVVVAVGAKEEKQGSLIEQCKEICVICQLGGSYCKKLRSWKCCPRSQAFSRPRSQFFTMWPDLEPANNLFIFSKIFNSFTSTHTSTPFCKCSKLTDVVKRNFFIFILQ